MDKLEDAVLIRKAQDGDSESFDILLSRYKPLVRARAASMFIAGSDHEDVVQEGMIGLFKAIRDFQSDRGARFATFAARCITAQITDAVRTALRDKHRPLNDSLSLQDALMTNGSGEDALRLLDVYADRSVEDPEGKMISSEAVGAIERFIVEELTDLERNAIRLLLAHRTYREAASQLGRNTKTVDNAIRRARRKFAKKFSRRDDSISSE